MKFKQASFDEGRFIIVCPHCRANIEVEQEQLENINSQHLGYWDCPEAECRTSIKFPSLREAENLKVAYFREESELDSWNEVVTEKEPPGISEELVYFLWLIAIVIVVFLAAWQIPRLAGSKSPEKIETVDNSPTDRPNPSLDNQKHSTKIKPPFSDSP